MKRVTYTLKTQVIRYLGTPAHWESRFSMEALMDETRKWRHGSSGGLTVHLNDDETVAVLRHNNGACLRIEDGISYMTVTDESGRGIMAIRGDIRRMGNHRAQIRRVASDTEAGLDYEDVDVINIPGMGIRAGVNTTTGRKIVLLTDHSGAVIDFPKAKVVKKRPELRTRFLHAVGFDDDTMRGRRLFEVYRAAVLVTAFDLGLQQDLRAFNTLEIKPGALENLAAHFDDGPEYDGYLQESEAERKAREARRGKAPEVFTEIPWDDTAQFQGFAWRTPERFMVSKTDDGFEMSADLDHREAILSQGAVLGHVLDSHPSAVSYRATHHNPGNLLRLLKGGGEIGSHRGDAWRYVVINTKKPGAIAKHIRTVLSANFGLNGMHAGAISFDKGHVMVAMDRTAHEAALDAEVATEEVLAAIERGDTGGQDARSFLQERFARGASLARVDAVAADGGRRTLADLMKQRERYEMLAALRDVQGGIGGDMQLGVA